MRIRNYPSLLLNLIDFPLKVGSFVFNNWVAGCFVFYVFQKALTTSSSFGVYGFKGQRCVFGLFFPNLLKIVQKFFV